MPESTERLLVSPTTFPTRSDESTERETGSARNRWDLLRAVLAITYLLGGIAHLVLAVRSPGVYEGFADRALVGAYTDAWRTAVVPNLPVLVPLVGLFEVGVAVALLWRKRVVTVGHAAGGCFQAGLILSGPWGPINAVLALVHLAASRRRYPTSLPSVVGTWRGSA